VFNFLLLALISLFAFSFLPAKASEKVDILVLQQDSTLLGMGATVELGPDFIQVNAKASGLTAVGRAPFGMFSSFDLAQRAIFSCPTNVHVQWFHY